MINVLVTAKDSQLSKCIESISHNYASINFIYKSSSELDITNKADLESVFESIKNLDYCINCAAYTAVDKAETEENIVDQVNHLGVKNLALACNINDVVLIHISTDFVFDGKSSSPYFEDDNTNPLSVYGKTKLKGEQALARVLQNHFIIRTSWLYSEFGNNFLKTMLKLGNERDELSIVDDQIGCPTYAKDLAQVLLKFIEAKNRVYGVYHYSNEGEISWHDFAMEIFKKTRNEIKLNKIKTSDYPTLAARPNYSVLDTSKISQAFNIKIPSWKDSLAIALSNFRIKKSL